MLTIRRPGAKPRPTDAMVERAIELVWRGYTAGGQQLYYTSIVHAVGHSGKLAKICEEAGTEKRPLRPYTLLAAMRKAESRMRRRLQRPKRELSPVSSCCCSCPCSCLTVPPAARANVAGKQGGGGRAARGRALGGVRACCPTRGGGGGRVMAALLPAVNCPQMQSWMGSE